ncbi:MAG: ATP-binding cassette domain-containing protein [Bacteroidales bacterium]|nr:ATP-binding cassette domain-containing protein [Bacteroidales bacterium]
MLIDYSDVEVCQGKQQILGDVNFSINEGEFVYITGKVGTGKSSLLKTIYGEVPLDKGKATVMDMNLIKCKKKKLPELRRKMGIIFQDFQLLTDRTVYSNLDFVLKATGWKIKSEREARIAQVLNRVGMKDKGDKLPSELSGGEQQRIAIARSILNHPALVLADEPTGNLDSETSAQITELLHNLVDEKGATVIMITHNTQLIEQYPGRIFECVDGKFQEVKNA